MKELTQGSTVVQCDTVDHSVHDKAGNDGVHPQSQHLEAETGASLGLTSQLSLPRLCFRR